MLLKLLYLQEGVQFLRFLRVSFIFCNLVPTIAQDSVFNEGLGGSKAALKIYNQLGQALEFELDGNKIDVSSFSKGMYLISIQKQDQSKLFKFLVY